MAMVKSEKVIPNLNPRVILRSPIAFNSPPFKGKQDLTRQPKDHASGNVRGSSWRLIFQASNTPAIDSLYWFLGHTEVKMTSRALVQSKHTMSASRRIAWHL
jgi:hypothetical protein